MELDFSPLRSRLWEDGIEQIGFSDLHGIVPERYAALPYGVTLVFRLCSGVVDEVEVRSKPTFTYFQHYRAVKDVYKRQALSHSWNGAPSYGTIDLTPAGILMNIVELQ